MAYNLKDVFYLGATHEYPHGTYGSAGIEGTIPIDVSAYVDPIAKGKTRGQGLAVYKVHYQVAGDEAGGMFNATDEGQATFGLSVKPYATTGDNSGAINSEDLTPASDLAIFLAGFTAPKSRLSNTTQVAAEANGVVYLEPSPEVPYVVVRDTIFQVLTTTVGMSNSDSFHISYRLECAMITLDTATLNQLLRTQTA